MGIFSKSVHRREVEIFSKSVLYTAGKWEYFLRVFCTQREVGIFSKSVHIREVRVFSETLRYNLTLAKMDFVLTFLYPSVYVQNGQI